MKALPLVLFVGVAVLASCTSAPTGQTVEQVPATASTEANAQAAEPADSSTTTASVQEITTMTESNTEPALACAAVTNFDDDEANENWLVVNDNVMGGRSLGDRTFVDNTMVFAGSINTDGGGFSSLRLPLEPGLLAAVDRVVIRARSNARTYMLNFYDSFEGRDRRISFRAPIPLQNSGEWETVTVMLEDLFPVAFGRPVPADPFRKDLVTRMGIMLSDGVDGEFKLEVDSIELCNAA